MDTLSQSLNDLLAAIDCLIAGSITAEELEDKYTTAVIIHDDYDDLNQELQDIVELLDNEAKNLHTEELENLQKELTRLISS